MKVWVLVEMFDDISNNIIVFKTKKSAELYFNNFVESNGGIEKCEHEYYEDGSKDVFYWWDENHNEIFGWNVEVTE